MTDSNYDSPQRQRLEALLLDAAVEPLSQADEIELRDLLETLSGEPDDSCDLAAAALHLAFLNPAEDAIPPSLREKILSDAAPMLEDNANAQGGVSALGDQSAPGDGHPGNGAARDPLTAIMPCNGSQVSDGISGASVGSHLAAPETSGDVQLQAGNASSPSPRASTPSERGSDLTVRPASSSDGESSSMFAVSGSDRGTVSSRWIAATGWVAALAAGVALIISTAQGPGKAEGVALTARRDSLLGREGTVQVDWTEGPHPFIEEISGNVVWNQQQQEGYMLFTGMPPNDPTIEQYQLWIIDPARDQHPIDGGVFNVDSTGRVLIPVNAKLPTIDPQAFAITIEKPGGVVVSDQSRLPLLAALH